MERDGFVFYRSFYEGIKDLPRDIQGDVLTAIMEYGLNGVTTENLKPVARAIFTLIKPQLDANNQRFMNGKSGGRPPKEKPNHNLKETKLKPNQNQTITEQEPKEKVKEKEKEKVKEESKRESIPPIIPQRDESDLFSNLDNDFDIKQPNTELSKKVAQKKVFIPPSSVVVQEYCSGRSNGISGEEFVNFYQSKGWMVGKNKMKDWQAAVRTWEQSRQNNGKSNYQTGVSGNNPPAQQATYNIQDAAGRLAEDFAKGNIPGVYR